MIRLLIGFPLLLLITCNSNIRRDEYALSPDNSHFSWIGDGKEQPEKDYKYYLEDPSPVFRKEFISKSELSSAKLLITAAGYYKASINGVELDEVMLDPAWTDFSKRVYYSEYEITNLIDRDTNCIGVTLGNGFYNPLPLKMWGSRNLRKELNIGRPVFIAGVFLEYKNGKRDVIYTDNSWRYSYGPIIRNNVYLGEIYDARREIIGWDQPGFDESSWKEAKISNGPGGKLEKAFFPPVRITERINPVNIYSPSKGVYIADMGVNFTGVYRIKLKGVEGDTITFRFGERIYKDRSLNPLTTVCGQIKRKGVGGPGAPDIAWQADTFIVGRVAETWYKPEFTFHTYRYMEIKGLDYMPEISNIEGLALHSDVVNNNSFSCSSDLINSIQEAVERTFRSNLVSVQSDCPAREKFGYGGDLNATSESFIYNFDMHSFYIKTIYDWADAINDSVFVDTAPYVGIRYCGLSWESAFLITQYYLYLYYNDIELVREMYKVDNKWMDKVARIHSDGWVSKGLSDHESLEPVPVKLTGTCHYLQCARIMSEFASVTGDTEKETYYNELAGKLRDQIKSEFWDKPVEGRINRQTLFSCLLYHKIIPDEEIETAKDSLLKAVNNGPSGHFTTGIFGTKYIPEVLSEYYSPKLVYDIVNSTNYPGWGFMIDNGATTIWETWKESDNTFSNCHPMFGTVSEWFFRWLGGIKPDPDHPGFRKFHISPSAPDDLTYVNCTYFSPNGKIISNWKKEDGSIIYHIEVPEGSKAIVTVPAEEPHKIRIKKSNDPDFKTEKIENYQTGKFELPEGIYNITVSN